MTLSTQATGDVPMCMDCGQYVYVSPHICQRAQTTACMTVTAYTDQVRIALTRIAADHEVTASGHRKKLSREQMNLIAREACLAMGWEWSRSRG